MKMSTKEFERELIDKIKALKLEHKGFIVTIKTVSIEEISHGVEIGDENRLVEIKIEKGAK